MLLLGIAYKPNIDDIRETPAFILWELLLKEASSRPLYCGRQCTAGSRVLEGTAWELSQRGKPLHTDGCG